MNTKPPKHLRLRADIERLVTQSVVANLGPDAKRVLNRESVKRDLAQHVACTKALWQADDTFKKEGHSANARALAASLVAYADGLETLYDSMRVEVERPAAGVEALQ